MRESAIRTSPCLVTVVDPPAAMAPMSIPPLSSSSPISRGCFPPGSVRICSPLSGSLALSRALARMSQTADDAKNGSEPYAKAPIKGTDIRNTPTDNANKGTDIRNTPTDTANKGTDNPATGYVRGRAPAASGAVGPEGAGGRTDAKAWLSRAGRPAAVGPVGVSCRPRVRSCCMGCVRWQSCARACVRACDERREPFAHPTHDDRRNAR
jgi:hypothetical protein